MTMHMRLAAAVVTALLLTGAVAGTAHADGHVAVSDDEFLKAIHQANLVEIAAGHAARKHATTDCVKAAGAAIVRDHTHVDAQVMRLADAHGVHLPSEPSPEQRRALADLQAKAGTPAYDRAWLEGRDVAHHEGLDLLDKEIRTGEKQKVRAAARAARPLAAMHHDMVRGGVCHAAAGRHHVPAGDGGQTAAAGSRERVGAAALTAGAVLTAAGTAWFARRRQATTGQ